MYIEPFSFGGLYGTLSKYGHADITGDGAMEFFTNRIKITTKWTAAYGTGSGGNQPAAKRARIENGQSHNSSAVEDKANFDGRM